MLNPTPPHALTLPLPSPAAPSSELIVDVGLVGDLKREAEQRVAAVQAGVRRDHLRTELLAERVRRNVWDAMAVKGAVVSGLRSQAQVHNFPLPQPQQHERVLRQVSLLRRVEMAEHRTLGVMSYSAMFRWGGSGACAGRKHVGKAQRIPLRVLSFTLTGMQLACLTAPLDVRPIAHIHNLSGATPVMARRKTLKAPSLVRRLGARAVPGQPPTRLDQPAPTWAPCCTRTSTCTAPRARCCRCT